MSPLGLFASCIAGTPAGECNDTGSSVLAGDTALVGIAVLIAVAAVVFLAARLLRRK